MKKQLIILGASGHGKVVADIAVHNKYNTIIFLDDNESVKTCGKYPVMGKTSEVEKFDGDVIVAVGNAKLREKLQRKVPFHRLTTLVHPNAIVEDSVQIGKGSVVMAGTVLNAGTLIGKGCIINTASSIDHDCVIGDFVHVAVGAHIAGNVTVGDRSWVGAGVIVSNNINICSECMIGAGAVVIENIKEAGTYIGVPAKNIKKKVLIVSTIPATIGQFNRKNIEILKELGYEVHIACNFQDTSMWTKDKTTMFVKEMKDMKVKCFQISFSRNLSDIKSHLISYLKINKLFRQEKYSFIHTHTPIASVIARIAAHQRKMKVIYTVHGFHFYTNAPIKNWLLFYPIEWVLSFWTDILITINQEDYKRARKHFHAKRIEYVPGVGVEIEKFKLGLMDRREKRKRLKLEDSDMMLLSIGELNQNKNHIAVIKTLARIKERNVELYNKLHYFIAGTGSLYQDLTRYAKQLHVSDHVHLLGFCTDVPKLLKAADIYILPSRREGLNVSLMEAMASGLACICGDIRGNRDLIDHNKGGYRIPEQQYIQAISRMAASDKHRKAFGIYNTEKVRLFSESLVMEQMGWIYDKFIL